MFSTLLDYLVWPAWFAKDYKKNTASHSMIVGDYTITLNISIESQITSIPIHNLINILGLCLYS